MFGGCVDGSCAGSLAERVSAKTRTRAAFAAALAALALAGCGGATHQRSAVAVASSGNAPDHRSVTAGRVDVARPTSKPEPTSPRLLAAATHTGVTGFVPAVAWGDQTAAWISRTTAGVTLMAFDQRLVALHLHAGTLDPGGDGWRFGPSVVGAERTRLVAAVNGGFQLATGAGGFLADGRVAVPLREGLGSIVTYADGFTEIGSWRHGVPASGEPVVSVRQNLNLLVADGRPAPTFACIQCWGATLGGVVDPARSALGITAAGRLVWAAGENLTLSQLAAALIAARVTTAVELDINPGWVAGYLYRHGTGRAPPIPLSVLPGPNEIPGEYLVPWKRDFFTIVARS